MTQHVRIRNRRSYDAYSPMRTREIWLERFASTLPRATRIVALAADLSKQVITGKAMDMSKAQEIAARIKAAKEKFGEDLDAIAVKLNEFDEKKSEVLPQVHGAVDGMRLEVDELEDDLRQLQNIPLAGKP